MNQIHQEIELKFKNKDGFLIGSAADMAVVRFGLGPGRKEVHYAGAKMDLVISRNNSIDRVKANKRQIGSFFDKPRDYEPHQIKAPQGEQIKFYLYSDGITDLIGGPKDKKLSYKNLEQILAKISHLPMQSQKKQLEKILVQWIGANYPNDDMLMLGFAL